MKNKWFLTIILGLSFLFRVVGLNSHPNGFTPDEASFGYDAYSLINTGKDQWGKSFPLVFKSFGDYKAPVYGYLAIPSIAVFGLNKFAVRLPNALLGTASVYVLYLLCFELFKKYQFQKTLDIKSWKLKIEDIATLLLAISPWHIMMSRGAFEANLITFFLPLGIYLFIKQKYSLSALVFGINLFTYHSAKLITPVMVLLLISFFWKEIKSMDFKKTFGPFLIFIFFLILTLYTITEGSSARIAERSITRGALEDGAKTKIVLIQNGMNPILARLLHNKYQVVAHRFITNYLQYFSPRFLFLDGPAETTYGMIRGFGVATYAEILGLLALIYFWKKWFNNKLFYFLILWLLISPIPASLATGVGFSANRAEAMIPVLQILSSLGIYFLLTRWNKLSVTLVTLVIFGLLNFLYIYIFKSPSMLAQGMLSENMKRALVYIEMSKENDEVVVPRSLSEPHIYIAFVAKIDPSFYQNQSVNWDLEKYNVNWVDQIPEYKLGKFTFKNVENK